MGQSRVLSMISMATKAGKTASGEFCTEREVKSGGAALVIVQEMRLTIRRRNLRICVTIITCQSVFIEIKIP